MEVTFNKDTATNLFPFTIAVSCLSSLVRHKDEEMASCKDADLLELHDQKNG
jgi:hypothetical protein